MIRKGRLLVSPILILQILQLEDGKVLDMFYNSNNILEVTVEHPEFPPVNTGDPIPIVTPIYTTFENWFGKVVLRRQMKDGKVI